MLKKLKISFFLASRQIKNANFYVSGLIIFIMTATFLNLVFISGILEGIVAGASSSSRENYSGDVIITPLEGKEHIRDTSRLVDGIEGDYTVRYLQGGVLKADHRDVSRLNEAEDSIGVVVTGIDFDKESKVTELDKFIVDGEYNSGGVLLGSGLLEEYDVGINDSVLKGVRVGDRVIISVGDNSKEYLVGGVIKSKLQQINTRVFMSERQFFMLTGRPVGLSDEIAVKNGEGVLGCCFEEFDAKAETWQESQGQFFDDLSVTFTLLGAVVGAIGLAVASVTLFIVIFINAISRERYIGIMKGIGIEGSIIKYSYMFQSVFYAFIGSSIGVFVLYAFLVPYFAENPIDFPFSDGILDVTYAGVSLRLFILFLSSVIAGLVPAHLIVKKNTIDSILGR